MNTRTEKEFTAHQALKLGRDFIREATLLAMHLRNGVPPNTEATKTADLIDHALDALELAFDTMHDDAVTWKPCDDCGSDTIDAPIWNWDADESSAYCYSCDLRNEEGRH